MLDPKGLTRRAPRRNVKQYPEASEVDGLLLLRIDAPLYFANVNPVRDALHKYEQRALESAARRGAPIRFIAIDLSPVTDIDASAVHFLSVRAPRSGRSGRALLRLGRPC